MRYRWANSLKVQVMYKGKSFFIQMEEEGLEVLQCQNIPVPIKMEKPSMKRKLNLQNTPPKYSKNKSKIENAEQRSPWHPTHG